MGIAALASDRMGVTFSVGEGGGSRGTIDSEEEKDDEGSNSGSARMRNDANDPRPFDARVDVVGFDTLREIER